MFSVYTISRQYGSGGTQFAKKLAELCGYTLIWREIINKAARITSYNVCYTKLLRQNKLN